MLETTFLEELRNQYHKKLPFVAYRKPNDDNLKAVFQYDTVIHKVKNFEESGFVFAPFDSEKQTILIPFDHCISALFDQNKLKQAKKSETISSHFNKDRLKHEKLITKAINAINAKKLEKVVLSRKETIAINNNNPIDLFISLLTVYTNVFIYVWYHPEIGCWLGATPETLIQVHGKRFKTMALAGTQLFSDQLSWKQKEKEEQQFVTDFITNGLAGCSNNLKVSKPYTSVAGTLAHIRSDISGSFKNKLSDVIGILHPTPAVCGLPKEEAKKFILTNENYDRTFYTGYLGELNLKLSRANNRLNTENKAYKLQVNTSDLYVNLRCMQLHDDSADIYVGGGITASSDPHLEFIETVNKTQTIKRIFSAI